MKKNSRKPKAQSVHPTGTLSQSTLEGIMSRAISEAPLGFLLADCRKDDNPVVYVNQSFTQMTGHGPAEVLGKPFPFLPGTDENQMNMGALQEAMETESRYSATFPIRSEDDETNYFELSMVPVCDESGRANYYAVMLKDAAFLGPEGQGDGDYGEMDSNRFISYMENAHEGIWRIDMTIPLSLDAPEAQQIDHIFQHAVYGEANNAMAKQFGFSMGREVVGLPVSDMMPQSDPKNVETITSLIRNRFHLNNFLSFEKGPEGSNLVFLNNMIPFIREGKLLHTWGSSLNITELYESQEKLKNYQEKLLRQKEALERKNIALKELIAHIELEKKEVKDKITANVEHVILPLLDRIRLHSGSNDFIEQHRRTLEDFTSSFGLRISDNRIKLTPREVEICNLVKNGLTNKEISALLNIAVHTVEKHRRMARKKLGLTKKGINLCTYLTSI